MVIHTPLGATIDNMESLLQKAMELTSGHDVQQVKANMVGVLRGPNLDGWHMEAPAATSVMRASDRQVVWS